MTRDSRVLSSFFSKVPAYLGSGIFQAASSLNPHCFGRKQSWTEIKLKSWRERPYLLSSQPAIDPRSTPGQLEFTVASFQHGLQKKRFCFSAIFPQRNQGEVAEEVTCSGPRAVEPSDLEVKADTESGLLSSTSHFSELCLLGPFRGQCACRQNGVRLWFYWTSCHSCRTHTEEQKGVEGGESAIANKR